MKQDFSRLFDRSISTSTITIAINPHRLGINTLDEQVVFSIKVSGAAISTSLEIWLEYWKDRKE